MSGWGACFFELGFIGFILIWFINRLIKPLCVNYGYYFVSTILYMVFFNAFPFSTPLASMIFGNLMYLKYRKALRY